MVTRQRLIVVAAVLIVLAVVLVVVGAVRGSGGDREAQGPPPAFDPPVAFDAGHGVALPRKADGDPLPIALHDLDAFVGMPDGLQVLDTRTGKERTTVPALDPAVPTGTPPPPPPTVSGSSPTVPLPAIVGGRRAVVAAFAVSVPGHGTTLGHPAVALLAVDPAGYAPVARMRIDLPVSLAGTDDLRSVRVVGDDLGTLVVVASQGAEQVPTSYAVDLATGRIAWHLAGFDAAAVVAHRVVGVLQPVGGGLAVSRVVAVKAEDGARAWTAPGGPVHSASVWTAGPGLVAVDTTDAVTGARALTVLDATAGQVRDTRTAPGDVRCWFDGRSATVCAQAASGETWAAGYDATTGHLLWQLPDAAAGRVAPRVSTAWHGTVYGETQNGTVALDARTGADRPTAPGAAPALVNAYVGISAATLSTPHPVSFRATS